MTMVACGARKGGEEMTREGLIKAIEGLKAELAFAREEVSSYTANVKGFKKDIKESMEMLETLEKRLQELDEEYYFKMGDNYYYAEYDGLVQPDTYDSADVDGYIVKIGNASKYEKYITETEKMVQLTRSLRLFLEMESYKDWEPDWENYNQEKHFIYYDYTNRGWKTDYIQMDHPILNAIYFPTKELAEKAIEEVVKPLERKWAK